ncbi:hypothetical protein [Paraburkholderia fungorum]|uniref:hypothetical protein n=1 Tax=Paraburkholderia fungorum TaxID=134537 RepID=UPI0038BCE35D
MHGFRSTYQDWVEDYDWYAEVFSDNAIARESDNKMRCAYQRGGMFEKRQKDDGALIAVLREVG